MQDLQEQNFQQQIFKKTILLFTADVGGNANIQVNQKGTGLVNGDLCKISEK